MNIVSLLVPKSEITWIAAHETVKTAIAVMERSGHSTLPVVARDGHYAGTVQEPALLRSMACVGESSLDAAQIARVRLFDLVLDQSLCPIGVHGPATTRNEAAWWEALLPPVLVHSFVPVVDDRRVFIGIVRRRDLLAHIVGRLVPAIEPQPT